jgi:hypothetical protein
MDEALCQAFAVAVGYKLARVSPENALFRRITYRKTWQCSDRYIITYILYVVGTFFEAIGHDIVRSGDSSGV